MGFIYESQGGIAIEGRKESFIVHDEDGFEPAPEFLNSDLDNLIEALTAYRKVLADG